MCRRHPGQAGQAAVADVLVDPLLDELRDPVDRRPDQARSEVIKGIFPPVA